MIIFLYVLEVIVVGYFTFDECHESMFILKVLRVVGNFDPPWFK